MGLSDSERPPLTSPSRVRLIAERIGLRPSKALGQNFLIDRNILRIILEAAELEAADRVLEVGPGLGVLTAELVRAAGRVTAIEKDQRLFAQLEEHFAHEKRLTLVRNDVLEVDAFALDPDGFTKVVSNLPYSAGSRFLVEAARTAAPPGRLVVTVQQEVAARLEARPGGRDFGLLSLEVQLTYRARTIKAVSPTCFWPRPAVVSGIVVLERMPAPPPAAAHALISDLARTAFGQRRKQLAATLGRGLPDRGLEGETILAALEAAGVPRTARPEAIEIAQWREAAARLTRSPGAIRDQVPWS